jgi:hypothetical protein
MPPRVLATTLLLCSTACVPSGDDACARFSVEQVRDGNGQLLHAADIPLGLEGAPVEVTLHAPLTSCVSDALRVSATVQGPDGASSPVEVVEGPVPVGIFGAVRARLRFQPVVPGPHALSVAFEPSLGARTVTVDVAAFGELRAGRRLSALDCDEPWPLGEEVIACEHAGRVTLRSPAGELTAGAGSELVVTGQVLWFVTPAGQLERHAFTDGGLVRTHAWPGFARVPTPALQTPEVALRFREDGGLTRLRLRDGGVEERTFFVNPSSQAVYASDRDGVLTAWTDDGCARAECTELSRVLALSGEATWRLLDGVRGWRWPWSTLTPEAPSYSLRYEAASAVRPSAAFERSPLWLAQPFDAGLRALVSTDDGVVTYSVFPRDRVLRVGAAHVLLRDEAGPGVVLVRRR